MPAPTHRQSGTPLHNMWRAMRQRCQNSNHHAWRYYGGKGIQVCPEWEDFATFHEWALSKGYTPGLSIERVDPARNYEPGNCEWIPRSLNTRRAAMIRWGHEPDAVLPVRVPKATGRPRQDTCHLGHPITERRGERRCWVCAKEYARRWREKR